MARSTKGRLFTRGKKNYYYLQYYLDGKQFVKSLKDDAGKPVTSKTKAEKLANKIIAPYLAKDEAQRREQAYSALKTEEDKVVEAERHIKYSIQIGAGWDAYKKSQFRPDSGDATLLNYQRQYNKFSKWIKENYSDIRNIAEVTAAIASDYAYFLESEGYSRNTYNKHITFMKLFYKVMIEDERAEHNPFERLKRKKQTTNSRKELNVEQVFNLLDKASGELKLLLALGYFTGFRRGDCCTLLWSEVDLARHIITRIPNKIKERSSNPQPVKIGISRHLHRGLSEIPSESRNDYVLPQMADYYLNNMRDRINRMIKKHFEQCGLKTVMDGTGPKTGKRAVTQYGFHSLRYSYISHHAEAGTPQAIIQANAGHANPAMTEHYTKISDESALRIANALDITPDAKLIEAVDAEPERQELHNLADTLPIDEIKTILKNIKK